MRSNALPRSAPAPEPGSRPTDEQADAIVVLGCRLFPGGVASERLRRRMMLGIGLYRQGAAPLLVMSGGGAGAVAEASVMRDLARDAGVPETALLLEAQSRNTFENAANTARLLHEAGKSRVVLVTDRVHLPRAARLFRDAGLDVVRLAGVPASSARRAIAGALYEAASLLRGLLRRRRSSPRR